jgi:hypothetical protein
MSRSFATFWCECAFFLPFSVVFVCGSWSSQCHSYSWWKVEIVLLLLFVSNVKTISVSVLAIADEVEASKLTLPSPLFLSGVDDPTSNLLSRAIALFNYTFAAPAASFSSVVVNVSDVSSTTVTLSANLRSLLMIQDTPVVVIVTPTVAVVQNLAQATFSVANQTLSVSFSVSDIPGMRSVVQAALNNATAVLSVSGDPAGTSALARVLKRAQRSVDLRASLNDRSSSSSSSSAASTVPVISLVQMLPLAMSLSADLSPLALSSIAGSLPPVSLDLVYQDMRIATTSVVAVLPTSAQIGVQISAEFCAQYISDALKAGKSPAGALAVRGSASTATSHVIQRVLDGLTYSLNSGTTFPPASSSPVSLSRIALVGDSGGQNIVADLSLVYGAASNTFLNASLPPVSVALRTSDNLSATILLPALNFVPR